MARVSNYPNVKPAPRPVDEDNEHKPNGRVLDDLAAREAEINRRERELAEREAKSIGSAVNRSDKFPGAMFISVPGLGKKAKFLYVEEVQWIAKNIEAIMEAYRNG